MKNLKRLGAAIALTFMLTAAAFACGEIPTDPCSAVSVTSDDAVVPGEIPTPPSDSGTALSVTEMVLSLLENAVF